MKAKLVMSVDEAQWKLERELVKKGYSMNGSWTSRYHKDEKTLTLSRNLKDYDDHVRAILWLEGTKWIGGISILVEEYGEYLLTYGEVKSVGDTYSPQSHALLKKRVVKIIADLLQWKYWQVKYAREKILIVHIHLALELLRKDDIKRAIRVLLMAARGDTSHTTVAKAMEILQMTFGRDIKGYAVISQIFEKVFK